VRQIFKEYTGIDEDKEFRSKAEAVTQEELELFEGADGEYTTALSKPVKFDLGKGGGSKWNKKICHLLAIECEKARVVENPSLRLSKRVRLPQLEELMRLKYERAWSHYSLTRARPGEEEADRVQRVANTLDNVDRRKRSHVARKAKYNNRLHTIEEQIRRGETVSAMHIAKGIVMELGEDGMSSEEEELDEYNVVKGFMVSKMGWRNADIGRMLRKLDGIRSQIKDTRGAIPARRFEGKLSQRKAVAHLSFQIYDREWLELAIERNGISVKERSEKSATEWPGYSSWEHSLQR